MLGAGDCSPGKIHKVFRMLTKFSRGQKNPRDMPYRCAWELVSPSFIVIDNRLSSSASLFVRFFFPRQTFSTFCKLCEFFLVNNPLPLTYFLSIASYCFTFDICLKWKSPVGTYRKLQKSVNLMISLVANVFCQPERFSCQGSNFSNLRLLA